MTPRTGRLLGAGIVLTGLLLILFGFLTWADVALAGADSSSLSGWGAISGGPGAAAGDNINEVITSLGGVGSYRPALLPTVLAGFGVVAGLGVVVRTSKVAAAGAVAVGLFVVGWGLYRALRPGDVAGLLVEGDVATAAVGPWVTSVGGLAMVALAVAVLAARAPAPPVAPRRRGIQPRR
ncbi:hypothetical protein [Nakamurella deserti]|uniref:hypothetical protein n=1 Tax=Nakamurella deserti TaxID=2164074 RepID=UPI000DBE49AA|nr:hypothetical protein [Nakamurella deserti]